MKSIRKTAAALIVGAAVAATTFGLTGSASAAAGQSFLYRGESLQTGDQIQRTNWAGTLVLVMQGDGNLVEYLYPNGGGTLVCWASNTDGTGYFNHADYQQDGNFVVYSYGKPVWASNTQWGGGQTVDMNSNGYLYVGTKAINNGCGW